jgi:hypothetical protein
MQVFTKLLLTSLPHELGQFILDSSATAATSGSTASSGTRHRPVDASPTSAAAAAVAAAGGAGVWVSGELCLTGPPQACLSACLTRSAEEVPAGNVSLTSFVQVGRLLRSCCKSCSRSEQQSRDLCKHLRCHGRPVTQDHTRLPT